MLKIRPFDENDWDGAWSIVEPAFRVGETYAFSLNLTEDEAHKVWNELPYATYVAAGENDEILGTYYIKTNQPGLGSHVCNCGT